MSQGAEAPIFRLLSRKWRPVDKRERRLKPFSMALPGADVAVKPRGAVPVRKNRMAEIAEAMKKTRATWNPWRNTK
jgi:hypothetical protein